MEFLLVVVLVVAFNFYSEYKKREAKQEESDYLGGLDLASTDEEDAFRKLDINLKDRGENPCSEEARVAYSEEAHVAYPEEAHLAYPEVDVLETIDSQQEADVVTTSKEEAPEESCKAVGDKGQELGHNAIRQALKWSFILEKPKALNRGVRR